MITGLIYSYRNLINGKFYIGQTYGDIRDRIRCHKSLAKLGKGSKFHNAIRKYGIDNFEMRIEEEIYAKNKTELIDLLNNTEILYIKKYDSIENGYNTIEGGRNVYKKKKPTGVYVTSSTIEQYDLNGDYIATYQSASEAERCTGVYNGHILKVCRGRDGRKQSGGFIWKFSNGHVKSGELLGSLEEGNQQPS